MKLYISQVAAGVGILGAALGQSVPPSKKPLLSFEVASIKPVGPLDGDAIMSGKRKPPGMSVDNALIVINSWSIIQMISSAYGVSRNQVVGGPAWLSSLMNTPRFDIAATMPEGATKQQIPEMLQALLAERFKLSAHREKRDAPAYALIVGRDGPTLKEAAPGMPESERPSTARPEDDRNSENGRIRYEYDSVTMEKFASLLSRNLDRPVVDQTGLKGRYQASYVVDLMADVNRALMSVSPNADPVGSVDPRDSIASSLKRLGLKLDSRVLPTDVIVIDHVEKMPTEN